MRPETARYLAASGLVASLAGLIAAAGCKSHTAPSPELRIDEKAISNYVGSSACAECHRSEFDVQSHSHHALTMRHADRRSLGSQSPPAGQIADTAYTVTYDKDGSFTFTSSSPSAGGAQLEYALGSGIANITFIGQTGKDHLTEFRMSLNPGQKRWYITPGQEARPDLELGEVYQGQSAVRCVLCHADTLQPGSVRPAEGSLGVGCESCHGPGAAHIAAMSGNSHPLDPRQLNSHPSDLKIANPGRSTPHEINTSCGTCHRNIEEVALTGLDSINTPRYQVYGLETSSCYRKSGNRISCITCHDPHADASTDLQHYERVCLSCHASGNGRGAKNCPINAKDKCIGCHMPKRQVMPFTKIPLQMTDHLIWAYRPGH